MSKKVVGPSEHFDFIEGQRRELKEQIARAILRAVRIERLLVGVEEAAELAYRELKEKRT